MSPDPLEALMAPEFVKVASPSVRMAVATPEPEVTAESEPVARLVTVATAPP